MRNLLLIVSICSITFPFIARSQDAQIATGWKNELQTGINFNQSSFSSNWKAGGVNALAISGFINGKAELKQETYSFTNDLQLLYGNVQNETQGLRKTADRIFFDSRYGYNLSKHWSVFASVNFQTQFDAGYEYIKEKDAAGNETGVEIATRISGFMSPGYLTQALGMEYKPVDYFSAQFGVGALRQSFVLDQTLYDVKQKDELYGVKKGDKIRNQTVFQFVANFDKEIMKNLVLKARYMGIADYEKLNGQGIVHRLDANITAKVNKYINVNLAGVLLYDADQDADVQYSQVMALGILYTFGGSK
jgi:hypothetical protein